MFVTLSGIVTLVSEVQLKKANSQILVTPSSIITFVIEVPHGKASPPLQSFIFPLPLIVSTPSLSRVHVQSPVVPLLTTSAANEFTVISGTLVIIIKSDNNNEMIFLVFFIFYPPKQ